MTDFRNLEILGLLMLDAMTVNEATCEQTGKTNWYGFSYCIQNLTSRDFVCKQNDQLRSCAYIKRSDSQVHFGAVPGARQQTMGIDNQNCKKISKRDILMLSYRLS